MSTRSSRPDIGRGLHFCREAVVLYEPTLQSMTEEELREYAVRRLLRDYYVRRPKELARDIRRYGGNYREWWEEWRNPSR